jgi:hypothetical protein
LQNFRHVFHRHTPNTKGNLANKCMLHVTLFSSHEPARCTDVRQILRQNKRKNRAFANQEGASQSGTRPCMRRCGCRLNKMEARSSHRLLHAQWGSSAGRLEHCTQASRSRICGGSKSKRIDWTFDTSVTQQQARAKWS